MVDQDKILPTQRKVASRTRVPSDKRMQLDPAQGQAADAEP